MGGPNLTLTAHYNLCNEDAETARRKLDGHGYDNLILNVKWAEKRQG